MHFLSAEQMARIAFWKDLLRRQVPAARHLLISWLAVRLIEE